MMSPRVTDLLLERLLLDELPPPERDRVRALVDADPALQARLESLRESDRAVREAWPAASVVPEIERRLHLARTQDAVARRRQTRMGAALLLPLVAAAIGLAVVQSGVDATAPDGPGIEATTPKGDGDAELRVHRRTRGGSEKLEAGATTRPGDTLQVAFRPGAAHHAVVFSVDGAGAVTLHWPLSRTDSTAASGRVLVPRAYALDDAPRFERFFLVTGDDPIDVGAVLGAGTSLARSGTARTGVLDLPGGLDQTDLLLRKETP